MSETIRLKDTDLKTTLGQDTDVIGLLIDVEEAETKQHNAYAKVTIIDKDVTLTAAIWDLNVVHLPTVKAAINRPVKLTGKPKVFGSGISYSVFKVQPLSDEELAEYGLTPDTFYNIIENRQELVEKLNNQLNSISNTVYGKIAIKALQNNWDMFIHVAAGKSMHHAAVGGLLWHTTEVMSIADTFYQLSIDLGYDVLCRPLLIAGAVVHDIGKCRELSTSPIGATEYTADSVLESHHMSGIAIVTEAATQLDLQHTTECAELCHVIAAHHESKDWGQIKEAAMIEAVLVSKADHLSATLNATARNIVHVKPGEQYTALGYNRSWVKSMGSFNNDMSI